MKKQDVPPIIAHLNKLHYDSSDWSSDAGIEQRGLGCRTVETEANVYQIETISKEYNR